MNRMEEIVSVIRDANNQHDQLHAQISDLQKSFGEYLGNPNCVQVCNIDGDFSFDHPKNPVIDINQGFGLLVKVLVGDTSAAIRLKLKFELPHGQQKLKLCWFGVDRTGSCVSDMSEFLFQRLKEVISDSQTSEIKFTKY